MSGIRSRSITTFRQFINRGNNQSKELTNELAEIHREIYAYVEEGDPTPFKPFRRCEYLTTIARMVNVNESVALPELIAHEILITQEVRELVLQWQREGARLFGISDKPDEASIPTEALVSQGYLPIHQTLTHAVGT